MGELQPWTAHVATRPALLLLDEPTAGMAKEESDRMVRLIGGLKGAHAVLLVEVVRARARLRVAVRVRRRNHTPVGGVGDVAKLDGGREIGGGACAGER